MLQLRDRESGSRQPVVPHLWIERSISCMDAQEEIMFDVSAGYHVEHTHHRLELTDGNDRYMVTPSRPTQTAAAEIITFEEPGPDGSTNATATAAYDFNFTKSNLTQCNAALFQGTNTVLVSVQPRQALLFEVRYPRGSPRQRRGPLLLTHDDIMLFDDPVLMARRAMMHAFLLGPVLAVTYQEGRPDSPDPITSGIRKTSFRDGLSVYGVRIENTGATPMDVRVIKTRPKTLQMTTLVHLPDCHKYQTLPSQFDALCDLLGHDPDAMMAEYRIHTSDLPPA